MDNESYLRLNGWNLTYPGSILWWHPRLASFNFSLRGALDQQQAWDIQLGVSNVA